MWFSCSRRAHFTKKNRLSEQQVAKPLAGHAVLASFPSQFNCQAFQSGQRRDFHAKCTQGQLCKDRFAAKDMDGYKEHGNVYTHLSLRKHLSTWILWNPNM